MREAIETFWSAVFAHGGAAIDLGRSVTDAPAVRHALAAVDPRLGLRWGRRGEDGYVVLVSLEADLTLGPLVDEMLVAAPEVDGWEIGATVDGALFDRVRNPTLFPDDENGVTLLRMAIGGDHLWRSRPVDFAVVVPDEAAADALIAALPEGVAVAPSPRDEVEDDDPCRFEVVVTLEMVPTHAAVTEMEARLEALAAPLGGRNDGWGCFSQSQPDDPNAEEHYLQLRRMVLEAQPADLGLEPSSNPVWAVLMETAYPQAVVTLVAIADGTVSLYFSSGGGMIGLGAHEGPRAAARALLDAAPAFLDRAVPATDLALPEPGHTRFYLLQFGGCSVLEALEADLGEGRSPLAPLFFLGHDVISQARQVTGD